jgi:hypothetical protein
VKPGQAASVLPAPAGYFVEKLRALHLSLREHLRRQLQESATSELAAVTAARGGDTIYGIDERGEEVLLEFCREWAREMPFRLVAEGLPEGSLLLPEGTDTAPLFRLIVDPIDGTRCIMYDKRSAWILSGVAPESEGAVPTLADIAVSMQTEVPTTRQYLSDLLWAVRGEGTHAERHNLLTGDRQPFVPRPSAAPTLAHGFATISKFFLGAKELTARLEETLFEEILGGPEDGNPLVFDDQYLSSGGQLYELMVGHDRFNADLRPIMHAARARYVSERAAPRLCAHPYDLCGELIAREAGVIVTDERGEILSAPLDIDADVCWIGYANEALRARIEPLLLPRLAALRDG